MKYAIYQMDVMTAYPETNRNKVANWTDKIMQQEEKPDTIVLPEMWNTGYALSELAHLADQNSEPTKSFLSELAKSYQINIIGGSIGNKKADGFFNTSLVFNRAGELVNEYDKIHLVPMLHEHQYLTGGQEKAHIFELDGIKMGLIICYDLRFPELSRQLALDGAQVLHIVAQWPDARKEHWTYLQTARAIENQLFVVSSNTVGANVETSFAGTSMIIDPQGEHMAVGGQSNEETITASLDLSIVSDIRNNVPVFSSRVPEMYS